MVTSKCTQCWRDVSSTALVCPQCGASLKQKETDWGVIVVVTALGVLGLLTGAIFLKLILKELDSLLSAAC